MSTYSSTALTPAELTPADLTSAELTPADVTPKVPALPEVEPADTVRAAVLAVPGVAELHAGAFGEVGTYLPGRRVAGIRLGENETRVHVAVFMGASVRDVAAAVRDAVAVVVPGLPVDVVVEDVVERPDAAGPAAREPTPA